MSITPSPIVIRSFGIRSRRDKVPDIVREIMRSLEDGTILVTLPPHQPSNQMGWTMHHPSGEEISRTLLERQCSAITPYGWRAVPELLKWLDHEEPFMRYIASTSLESITDLHNSSCHEPARLP